MRYVEMQLLEPYIVQSSFNDTKELNSTFQALVIINQSMLRTLFLVSQNDIITKLSVWLLI